MVDNGSILILVIFAFIFGRKSIILGFVIGVATGVVLFFVINEFEFIKFFQEMMWAIVLSISASVLGRIILPGIKGGGHNSGPTYIGGHDGYMGQDGGIVHTINPAGNYALIMQHT